jgi:LDH2 family malate/lactate/ureidoglycolate dehydrogenase
MNSMRLLTSIRTGTVAVSRSAGLKSHPYLNGSVSAARSAFSTSQEAGVVQVPIDEARTMTAKALKMIGWDDDDAALQAEIMTAAELCGNNQGLVKMYNPSMMTPAPGAGKPVVERETSTSAVINGNQAPGMLAAVTAADLAVAKVQASEGPIAIVCTNNTSTSSGQLAFYVERMARQGIIGIAMCNSPEFVAAAKGGKPVFGTNPMAFGIPQKGTVPFTVRYIRSFHYSFV